MSNRGRHRKKTKIDYVKIQKVVDNWNFEFASVEMFNKAIKQILHESRKA